MVQDEMMRQLWELEKQVDAKMGELDEASTKNVQLGARVHSTHIPYQPYSPYLPCVPALY